MPGILIVYGTTEGQTAKISDHIAALLRDDGHTVEMIDAHSLPKDLDLKGFDGIIVGSSVHTGKHDRGVVSFVKANLAALEDMPSAFFSVSLTAAGRGDKYEADIEKLLSEFSDDTGWRADKTGIFAGALMYSQYNLIKWFILKTIAKHEGGDTDTSRDYEYTDWNGVTQFAKTFAATLPVKR